MAILSKYELERQANIEKNKLLLQCLGLGDTSAILGVPKPIIPKPSTKTKAKKRKSEALDRDERESKGEQSSEPAKKSSRNTDEAVESTSLRRSSRNAGKKVDYLKVESDRSSRSYTVSTPAKRAMQSEPSVTTMRTQNPCVNSLRGRCLMYVTFRLALSRTASPTKSQSQFLECGRTAF